MSAPTLSTARAARLDRDLGAAMRDLRAAGLDCDALEVTGDGRLHLRVGIPRAEPAQVVLEEAGDDAPRGQALGIGRRRLVVLGPEMYAKDAQALLAQVRDALDLEGNGPLSRWLTAPQHGSDRVPRSGGGLARALAGRVALGRRLWGPWVVARLVWTAGEEDGGVEIACATAAGDHRTYLLTEDHASDAGVEIARTPLGRLLRLDGPGADEEDAPLDGPLGFIFSRALPLDAAWTDAGDATLDLDGIRALKQKNTSLIGDCSGGGPEAMDVRRSRFFDVWGTADALGNSASVAVRSDRVLLMHASRECALATNTLSGDLAVGMRPWGPEPVDFSLSPANYLVTDVDDGSIVMGGEERYQAALLDGLSREPDGEVVVFQGCDYHMIGDDVRGACRRCASGDGHRVRFMQPEIPQFQEMDSRSWWGNFLTACTGAGASRHSEPQVNLVGFGPPGGDAVRAATALLEAVGVRVGASALPFPSEDAVARWGEAWTTIVSPWLPVDEAFTYFLRKQGHPHLALPLPYGVEGCRTWTGAVLDALGLPRLDPPGFDALLRTHAPGLEALMLRAHESGGRIGVIFDKGSLEEILAPAFFFGASPLDLLCGVGFEVTFVHAPQVGPERDPADAALSALARRGASFEAWAPGTPIDEVLGRSGFDLVYCDALDTDFIRRGGAVPLDIRDMRMGLAGAARNIEHLLAGHRLQLYRRRRPLGGTP